MNEIRLKEFWEKGYTVIPGAVSAETVANVLRKAPKLAYRSIFKEVFSEQFDARRMQAPFPYPSVKEFMDMSVALRRNIIKKANMRWKDTQWVVLKSLPGGGNQAAHRDFPGFEISKAREQYDTIQAGIMIGLMPKTTLIVYESCFAEADYTKRKIIEYGPGDCVVFRGDLVHAGTSFESLNYRVHCVLTVKGVEWMSDVIEAAAAKVNKCKYCGFKANAKLEIRNHARLCSHNPNRQTYLMQYNANNKKGKSCDICKKDFNRVNSYYKHRARHHKKDKLSIK